MRITGKPSRSYCLANFTGLSYSIFVAKTSSVEGYLYFRYSICHSPDAGEESYFSSSADTRASGGVGMSGRVARIEHGVLSWCAWGFMPRHACDLDFTPKVLPHFVAVKSRNSAHNCKLSFGGRVKCKGVPSQNNMFLHATFSSPVHEDIHRATIGATWQYILEFPVGRCSAEHPVSVLSWRCLVHNI